MTEHKEKLIKLFCGDEMDITAIAELKVDDILKELEASIRKEVVEGIYNIVDERVNELKEARGTGVISDVDSRYIEVLRTRYDIKEYALSKGITLK